MFMERTPRILLALALMTTATPAVASDFRGFFTIFMATPLLMAIALGIGSILLRRYTAHRAGAMRCLPALTALAALPPLAWLGIFAQEYVYILAPTLCALWLWGAWHFWRHPGGRAAVYTARSLLVVTALLAGLMAFDMYNATDDLDDLMGALWVFACLAVLVALALYVCIKVGQRRTFASGGHERPPSIEHSSGGVAGKSTADSGASPGGA